MDFRGLEADIVGPFGALILAIIVLYFLYRLHVQSVEYWRGSNERAWSAVGEIAAALRENNALVRQALDGRRGHAD